MSRKREWGRRSSDNQAYPKGRPDKDSLPRNLKVVSGKRRKKAPVGLGSRITFDDGEIAFSGEFVAFNSLSGVSTVMDDSGTEWEVEYKELQYLQKQKKKRLRRKVSGDIDYDDYITRVESAVPHARQFYFGGNLDERYSGAMRLAREIGYGLRGADEKTLRDIIPRTYSTILVKNTFDSIGVPADASDWNETILAYATGEAISFTVDGIPLSGVEFKGKVIADDGYEYALKDVQINGERKYKPKYGSATPDVVKAEDRARKRASEDSAKRDFKPFKERYPKLKYGDVQIVTPTRVKMKDGKIYHLKGRRKK